MKNQNVGHYSWSIISTFGTMIISFTGNVLIARLLTPEDYGLIAMLAIFIAISMNFIESGFADYLVRTKNVDETDFSTVFIHNLVFACGFYFLLYFSAPFIADFYKRQELVEIVKVLGLSMILHSMTLSEMAKMRKKLEFKKIAMIMLLSNLGSIIVAYILAIYNYGYWSLVSQTLSIAILTLLFIVVSNRWLPSFKFSWQRYIKMRRFGNNMLLSYLTNQLGENLNIAIIGKFYPVSTLGFYSQATKINTMLFQGINKVVLTTSYSIVANEQDKSKRKALYINILQHFLFIHFSISFFVLGIASPLIIIIFGEQWSNTAPLLQLLIIARLFNPLATLNSNIIKVENQSSLYRNLTFLRNGLNLVFLLFTFRISIEAILLGQIFARIISIITDVLICGKYIEFYPREQFQIAFSNLLAPLLAFLLGFLLLSLSYSNWLQMAIYSIFYTSLLILLNYAMKNPALFFYSQLITAKIKKTISKI